MKSEKPLTALAIVAHADDAEFMMAGTLALLGQAGCNLHVWNVAQGDCGSATLDAAEITSTRLAEAKNSCEVLGATYHHPLFPDLGVFYDAQSLAKVAAGVREIAPDIVLTHPFQDYMEDHQNTARLATTAAFALGMKNFKTHPPRAAFPKPVALYHALPHGLRGALREPIIPGFCVDISSVISVKADMLACHRSQDAWLGDSQGMGSLATEMREIAAAVGAMTGDCEFAEGWSRHSHLGFADEDFDPIADLLSEFIRPVVK